MTVLCLHGLVPSGDIARRATRTADAPPHDLVPLGPVVALVSEMAEQLEDETASLSALLAHDVLLGGYLSCGPVLPVRFGTFFSDVAALTAALSQQAGQLATRLAALEGLAEYALAVEGDKPVTQPVEARTASGRDFLLARKAARDAKARKVQTRDDHLRRLHDSASAAAENSDLRPPHPSRLMSLSLLMSPDQAESLRASLSGWMRDSGLNARLTGPFPAYSFADLSGESAADARSRT